MGKAVPKGLKSRGNTIIKLYKEQLSLEFEKNKAFVNSLKLPFTTSVRNTVAGYITKKMKQQAAA